MSSESSRSVASFHPQASLGLPRCKLRFGMAPALAACASLLLACGEKGEADPADGVAAEPSSSSSGPGTSGGQDGTGSPAGAPTSTMSSGSDDDPAGGPNPQGPDDSSSDDGVPTGSAGEDANGGAGGSGPVVDDAAGADDGATNMEDSGPSTDDADGNPDDAGGEPADDAGDDDGAIAEDDATLPPGDGGSDDDSPGAMDDSQSPDAGDDGTAPDAGEEPGADPGLDPFGIRELYPSAPSGGHWTSEHWGAGEAYEIDSRTDGSDPSGLSGMRGTGSLFVTGDGQLVLSGSEPRIYVYPGDAGPWRDVEVTVYYQRVADDDTAWGGLVIGARSGVEGHGDTPCDAHTYYSRMRHDGESDFEKELKHPASSTGNRVSEDELWPPSGEVPRETWIGWKYVIYNTPDQSAVKLEAYRDLTGGADGGDWELVNEDRDEGDWAVETDCDEHSPTGGESTLIRLEGGVTFIRNTGVEEARYRWLTIREISP